MTLDEQRNMIDMRYSILTEEEKNRMMIISVTKRMPKAGDIIDILINRSGTLHHTYTIDKVLGVLRIRERHAYVVVRSEKKNEGFCDGSGI